MQQHLATLNIHCLLLLFQYVINKNTEEDVFATVAVRFRLYLDKLCAVSIKRNAKHIHHIMTLGSMCITLRPEQLSLFTTALLCLQH